jgi:hypothetical protein
VGADGGGQPQPRTVLGRLGRKATIDLLEHSRVLAKCSPVVVLNYPLLALPGRDRFARL